MKKQLIKEISEINKLIKNDTKTKKETKLEINNLEKEINIIERKIQNYYKDKNEYNKIPKITNLQKLYESMIKKNKEKIFIEYNLLEFQKENDNKLSKLQKHFKDLTEKDNENNELIEKKIEKLNEEYDRVQRHFQDDIKQEQYIISPETMSIHMFSKITTEIDFMDNITKQTKEIKLKNDRILKDIDSGLKKLYVLKSKKESSTAYELSTAAGKNSSSHLEKKNNIFQQLENINNNNAIINNENQDTTSSISMEIETNLNLNELPSDDESLRFIDKVFDVKSNIKPIKNKFKISTFYPPSATIPIEKTRKAEPIKIERPIDYKSKEDKIEKEIDIIKKEIEEKMKKIEEIKEKKSKLEEENIKKENNLKHAYTKIKIIKDQIDVIKKQIEDFEQNKDKGEYYRVFSINNIINNRNYYLYNINNENNNISDLETLRK